MSHTHTHHRAALIALFLLAVPTASSGSRLAAAAPGLAQSAPPACKPGWTKALIDPNPGINLELEGVAALSLKDVWAVGTSVQGKTYQTLTEHWDGTGWQRIPSPNLNPPDNVVDNRLMAVAGLSADDVWALGTYEGVVTDEQGTRDTGRQPMTLHWDGTTWELVDNPGHGSNLALADLAGVGPRDLWAVGMRTDKAADSGAITLAAISLRWDGQSWSQVPVPVPDGADTTMSRVGGSGPTDVWAIGSYTGPTEQGVLVEHWDGANWTMSTLPSSTWGSDDAHNFIAGDISSSASNDAWLVGTINTHNPSTDPKEPPPLLKLETVIMHWDGTAWTRVPIPNPGSPGADLFSVSAASKTEAWAVGSTFASSKQSTLTMHWNGTAWQQVPSPDGDPQNNILRDVEALPGGHAWAGGYGVLLQYTAACQVPASDTPAARVTDLHEPGVLYFALVGHTLRDPFRSYWEAHGGLAQFGYPLTEPFTEESPTDGKRYLVQYFERARFEHHPDNEPPYDVLLGLLGRTVIQDRTGEGAFKPLSDPPAQGTWFPQTGHALAAQFLDYWQTHGGLPVYGYPISEPFTEASPTDGKPYLVQYFERNRLEFHPELPPAYRVSLGLLGVQILRARSWLP